MGKELLLGSGVPLGYGRFMLEEESSCLKKETRVSEGSLSLPGDSPWIAPLSSDDVVGHREGSGARRAQWVHSTSPVSTA